MNVGRYFGDGWAVWRWQEKENKWGEPDKEWVKHLDVEGIMRPLSGEMRNESKKDTPISDHRFYCNPIDVKAGDKIKKDDEEYHVNFVQNVMNMDIFLQVDCNKLPSTERQEYEE